MPLKGASSGLKEIDHLPEVTVDCAISSGACVEAKKVKKKEENLKSKNVISSLMIMSPNKPEVVTQATLGDGHSELQAALHIFRNCEHHACDLENIYIGELRQKGRKK